MSQVCNEFSLTTSNFDQTYYCQARGWGGMRLVSKGCMKNYYEFCVIAPGDNIRNIFRRRYGLTEDAIKKYMSVILSNNAHLTRLEELRPGQVVDLSLDAQPVSFGDRAQDMRRLETIYSTMRQEEKRFIHESPHVLASLSSFLRDVGVPYIDGNLAAMSFAMKNYGNAVEEYGQKVAAAYARGEYGSISSELANHWKLLEPVKAAANKIPQFFRAFIVDEFERMNRSLNWVGPRVQHSVANILRLRPETFGSFNPFSNAFSRFSQVLKRASIAGTVTTYVLPPLIAAGQSVMAYGTDQFGTTTAGGAGNVTLGLVGSYGANAICKLVFSGPSYGTSLFWCSFIGMGTVGYGFGKVGELAGKKIYNWASPAKACNPLNGVVNTDKCALPIY